MHWGGKIVGLQRQRENTAMDLGRIVKLAEKQIRKVFALEESGM